MSKNYRRLHGSICETQCFAFIRGAYIPLGLHTLSCKVVWNCHYVKPYRNVGVLNECKSCALNKICLRIAIVSVSVKRFAIADLAYVVDRLCVFPKDGEFSTERVDGAYSFITADSVLWGPIVVQLSATPHCSRLWLLFLTLDSHKESGCKLEPFWVIRYVLVCPPDDKTHNFQRLNVILRRVQFSSIKNLKHTRLPVVKFLTKW